jgi:hypothetical protein
MNIGERLRDLIDSRFLMPTSRLVVAAILWVLARWDHVLATICLVVAGCYFFFLVLVTHHIFWDIEFYGSVVKAMAAGVSPYNNAYISRHFSAGYSLGFVYPPFVADAFYKFSWLFLTPVGWALLVIAHVVSWLSIPYLLAGSPKNWYSRDFLYIWALYLVLFGLGGMRLLVVGNISAALFALMVFSIVVAVRTKEYKWFWGTVLVCSFFKIYFLAFLLLPVILDRRYVSAVVLICALIALYGLNYFTNPVQFSEYVAQIAGHSGETGLSIFSIASQIIKATLGPNDSRLFVLALGIHLTFTATILLVAYAIAKHHARPERFDLFCCWVFMSAFLISPRIFDYDLAVVTIPFVLLARNLLIEGGLGISVAAIVAGAGLLLVRTPSPFQTAVSDWSATFTILGVWLGTSVHLLIESQRPRLETRGHSSVVQSAFNKHS